MEARRALAQFVRNRPWLWDAVHPAYDRVRQLMRDARIRRAFGGRLASSDAVGQTQLSQALAKGGALGLGKIGGLEAEAAGFYLSGRQRGEPYPNLLRGQMFLNVGLFPATDESLDRFCQALIAAACQMDIMGVMGYPGEPEVLRDYAPHTPLIPLRALDPWYFPDPWSRHLAGRRVTVVSPFARTIEKQYARRAEIWPGTEVLPEFQLRTVRMGHSPALATPEDASWEDRFARIRDEVEAEPYDVVLVGAGGISLLLAAHAKTMGRIGFHMGGPTQILFGVRGKRWDSEPFFQQRMTPAWVRPDAAETPSGITRIEQGCYW
ncbi:MAG: hypothetical protein JWR10_1998 [Rubritepida sp.]|nr:hypothetical protein [Rubritepida sp.]